MIRFCKYRLKAILPWITLIVFIYCWHVYQEYESKQFPAKNDHEAITKKCCSQLQSQILDRKPEQLSLKTTNFYEDSLQKTSVNKSSSRLVMAVLTDIMKIRYTTATTTTTTTTTTPVATTTTTTTTTTTKPVVPVNTTLVSALTLKAESFSAASIKGSANTSRLNETPTASTPDPMDEYHFNNIMTFPGYPGINNPHPFVFTMNPEQVCQGSDVFLLILIHSHPENFDRRQVIRQTWGNTSCYQNDVVKRVFILGETSNSAHGHLLKMESMVYKDIIQENFLDTYRNLTYKAIAGLKWVTHHCNNTKFVLKSDDDAFVNLFVFLKHLKSKLKYGVYGNMTLACNAWPKEEVARTGKWTVTVAERKHPYWPIFCQGLAYIYTPDVASAMYSISFDVPYLWLDDVYVTGFLARRLKIKHVELDKTFVRDTSLKDCISGSKWYLCLFSHVKTPDVTESLWRTLLSKPHLPRR